MPVKVHVRLCKARLSVGMKCPAERRC